MLKAHFTRFFAADPNRLHFAAHSHHPWPDVTFEAQHQCWLDAARFVDDKWDHVFGQVLPEAQRHIAAELNLASPSSLAFAPNTHELVVRLLSCLPERARVVTTDSEFHSFERQARRLEEDGLLEVVRVPSAPFETFNERFVAAAQRVQPHLVFFSHVFFNSGAVVQDVAGLVSALPSSAHVVIDGYHGFCAVPTDLAVVGQRAFYLAGGYKYAMAGEGACFLQVPASVDVRPRNTGWFAAFGALEEKASEVPRRARDEREVVRVPFATGGARFFGATFDPSGLYRLNAAMRWRAQVGLTTLKTREHAHALQRRFLLGADAAGLVVTDERRGQFLTFRREDARARCAQLKTRGVKTDARDDRLRFGFGVYQDEADVDRLLAVLR